MSLRLSLMSLVMAIVAISCQYFISFTVQQPIVWVAVLL